MHPDFLDRFGRQLEGTEYYRQTDNYMPDPADFKSAQIRILLACLTPGKIRASSQTYTTLRHLFDHARPGRIFFDSFCLPTAKDLRLARRHKHKFFFGSASGRFWRDFDVIFLSLSVLMEVFNIPYLFTENGVSPNFQARLAEVSPLILLGGSCAPVADIIYGRVNGPGTGCLVDGVYLGAFEGAGLTHLLPYLMTHDTRRDKRDHLIELANYCPGFYVPGFFDFKFRRDAGAGYLIEDIRQIEAVPPVVHQQLMPPDAPYPAGPGPMHLDGERVSMGQVAISSGCAGYGLCTFCFEGWAAGPWRERAILQIQDQLDALRRYNAVNYVTFLSYNANYYSNFPALLIESAARASRVSLMNMRADVIAARPDYLQMAKVLGLARISLAVEGIGERLRSGFLNKNLDLDAWLAAAREVFMLRLTELKAGLIYTGYETPEDFEASLREFLTLRALRSETGARTSLRVVITPLICYPHTPLARVRRIAAIRSAGDDKSLLEYINALHGAGIRGRIAARGRSTFVNQWALDMGRAGTAALWEVGREFPVYWGTPTDGPAESLLADMAADGITPEALFGEKPEDMRIWSEPVVVTDRAAMINFSAKLAKAGRVRPCLSHPANGTGACGNCGRCRTAGEKRAQTHRAIAGPVGLDILSRIVATRRARAMLLVHVRKADAFYYVSSKFMAHRIAALINVALPAALEAFFRVGQISLAKITADNQRDFITGNFLFAIEYLRRFDLEVIPNPLMSCDFDILGFRSVGPFVGESGRIMHRIIAAGQTEKSIREGLKKMGKKVMMNVRVPGRGRLSKVVTREDLLPPAVRQTREGAVVYAPLPMDINPWMYLSSIIGRPYGTLIKWVPVQSIYTLSPVGGLCRRCDRQVYHDVADLAGISVCPACLAADLAGRETN